MKEKLIFTSITCLAVTFLFTSCNSAQPNKPYTPDTQISSRNKVPAINGVNLYALLLSPTYDQMELLDLSDNRVKLTVATGRKPVELAVSPDRAHILVINQSDGTVSSYYREDNQKIQSLGTIGSGLNPTDVLFNNTGTEAYVAYQGNGRINVVQILNRARPVIKRVISLKDNSPAISATPYKLAISSDDSNLYAIDQNNGTLYSFKRTSEGFIQENSFKLSGNDEHTSLEDLAFYDNKLYISDSANARITVFDTKENKVLTNISLTTQEIKNEIFPGKIAISVQTKKLYVANQGSSTIGVIDLKNNSLLKHIFLSQNTKSDSFEPSGISISNNGNSIYVTNSAGRNLSIISGKEDKLLRNIGTTESSGTLVPLSAIEMI